MNRGNGCRYVSGKVLYGGHNREVGQRRRLRRRMMMMMMMGVGQRTMEECAMTSDGMKAASR